MAIGHDTIEYMGMYPSDGLGKKYRQAAQNVLALLCTAEAVELRVLANAGEAETSAGDGASLQRTIDDLHKTFDAIMAHEAPDDIIEQFASLELAE